MYRRAAAWRKLLKRNDLGIEVIDGGGLSHEAIAERFRTWGVRTNVNSPREGSALDETHDRGGALALQALARMIRKAFGKNYLSQEIDFQVGEVPVSFENPVLLEVLDRQHAACA